MKKYSFNPVVNEKSRILILGSLPGEKSLEKNEYYAFPQNAFWKIMFDICGKTYNNNYEEKCKMLLDNNIALWDMIYSGNREGSLDSNIKNEIPNDLNGFLKEYSNISKILLNGKKAEAIFKKNFKNIDIVTVTMPSTSPANARMKYSDKFLIWKKEILY